MLVLVVFVALSEGVFGSGGVRLRDGVDLLIAVTVGAGWADDNDGGGWFGVMESESCVFEVGDWSGGNERGRDRVNEGCGELHFRGCAKTECGCVKLSVAVAEKKKINRKNGDLWKEKEQWVTLDLRGVDVDANKWVFLIDITSG